MSGLDSVRIGISGSYGGFNLGDEAILECMIRAFRESVAAEISVFSKDPEDTARRHQVERIVPVLELTREEVLSEIRRLHLFILGGGGILYDAHARRYLREAFVAIEAGIPLMVYAVGAGPLNEPAVQEQVRDCLSRASVVTVRDRVARQLLEEIGVRREVVVTADPAFLLESQPVPEDILGHEAFSGGKNLVGISVREPGAAAPDIEEGHYHTILANSADFMIDRFGAEVVFVPMERKAQDLQQCHAVISRMLRPQNATVLQGEFSSCQLLGLMGHFNFAVGMRLHFLIFAALRGIPFVGLPYSPKVHGFLKEVGLGMPPLRLVNAGRLIAHIDEAWDHRQDVIDTISKAVPVMRERAAQNHVVALQVLRDRYGPLPRP